LNLNFSITHGQRGKKAKANYFAHDDISPCVKKSCPQMKYIFLLGVIIEVKKSGFVSL